MSSLKRSSKVGQRIHQERAQPESRAHLGLLEKKKDYVKRAKDYNYKKRKLRKLRQKALSRNPDEFHFHMIRSHIGEDGIHRENTPEPDEDTVLQKKLKDLENLRYKIEKLKESLHFTSVATEKNTHTIFVDNEDEDASDLRELLYFKEAAHEQRKMYSELLKRMQRAKELKIVMEKLEVRRNIAASKGKELKPKKVEKGEPMKAGVYKWVYERKK
ncbi:unnamed protein product [Gongylonema pulchrum]|uniref:U3 small nucleolar RNA-associated protein 11 n=1 Tax=Gongylonema pulchrum TaxID=637853 RepID=A0A183DNS6_9BILA|nr:unnamed protein product [Gongylonema pulchrum]